MVDKHSIVKYSCTLSAMFFLIFIFMNSLLICQKLSLLHYYISLFFRSFCSINVSKSIHYGKNFMKVSISYMKNKKSHSRTNSVPQVARLSYNSLEIQRLSSKNTSKQRFFSFIRLTCFNLSWSVLKVICIKPIHKVFI